MTTLTKFRKTGSPTLSEGCTLYNEFSEYIFLDQSAQKQTVKPVKQ